MNNFNNFNKHISSIISFYAYEFNDNVVIKPVWGKELKYLVLNIVTGLTVTILSQKELLEFFDTEADLTASRGE